MSLKQRRPDTIEKRVRPLLLPLAPSVSSSPPPSPPHSLNLCAHISQTIATFFCLYHHIFKLTPIPFLIFSGREVPGRVGREDPSSAPQADRRRTSVGSCSRHVEWVPHPLGHQYLDEPRWCEWVDRGWTKAAESRSVGDAMSLYDTFLQFRMAKDEIDGRATCEGDARLPPGSAIRNGLLVPVSFQRSHRLSFGRKSSLRAD